MEPLKIIDGKGYVYVYKRGTPLMVLYHHARPEISIHQDNVGTNNRFLETKHERRRRRQTAFFPLCSQQLPDGAETCREDVYNFHFLKCRKR